MENLNLGWRLIDGEKDYFVSPHGSILHKDKVLSPYNDGNGYRKVSLSGRKIRKVHRLVAIAFLPNPHNYRCVNHKDGNKANNRLENLEWCTHSDNRKHALKIGLIKQGHERSDAKLSAKQVINIRGIYSSGRFSHRQIAARFKVSSSTIHLLLTNKTYKNAV